MASAQKPGEGSTQPVALPLGKECSLEHNTMRALWRSSCFSLLIRVVKVCKETVCLSTRINCWWHWATSVANEITIEQGASLLDWGWKYLGIDFTDSQM